MTAKTHSVPVHSAIEKSEANRYTVKVATIDPTVPNYCVKCLNDSPDQKRILTFRRSDGSVERVSAVHWPYCSPCLAGIEPYQRQQRLMTLMGGIQTFLILYMLGGALDYYDIWKPILLIFVASLFAFWHFAKSARALWGLEWARIEDVYKGGIGAAYSFRNMAYAEHFAKENMPDSIS